VLAALLLIVGRKLEDGTDTNANAEADDPSGTAGQNCIRSRAVWPFTECHWMLSEQELEGRFRSPEGELVERKRNADSRDDIRKTIAAFANDLPNTRQSGVIFFGLEDNGNCSNLNVTDTMLQDLSHLRADGKLIPFPIMRVGQITVDACSVAFAEVAPTDNPPTTVDNITYVRVGPTTRRATLAEERVLIEKRRWGNLPFDAHPVAGATVQDLDLGRFEREILPAMVSTDALAANQRSTEERLLALRLLHPDGHTPTSTAILVTGNAPNEFFPGAYIQLVRVNGTELTETVIDNREFRGPSPDQLRQLDNYLSLNVLRRLRLSGVQHQEQPEYPIEALRQLIRNAVIHRNYEGTNAPVRITWYSDRIEIASPGGPFGQVTAENFGLPSVTDYRNPTLAATLKDLGFVERFGVGIAIARKALAENGNPPPEFTVYPHHILAVVRTSE
jgi:ATP-dependent DNA helicase RecG